ncbi:MAG: AMP-binding protein [Myxococcales bacterium]|nr:AMP-binding protein [Myxococcales bacterium]
MTLGSRRLVAEFLEASASKAPDKIALVAGAERLSYADLDARANRLARALRARGVTRGERVLIQGDNQLDTAVALFATLKCDAIFSVVNPQVKADKLAYMLDDAGARALIAEANVAPTWLDAYARCVAKGGSALRSVMVLGTRPEAVARAVDAGRSAGLPEVVSLDAAAAEQEARALARHGIDLDTAAIIYTSGSTGEPKGAMLSHRNVDFASWSVTALLENTADEVILGVVPVSFNYGLYQLLMSVRLGARLVLERSFAFPVQILQRCAAEGVTGFPGVPTMFATLGALGEVPAAPLESVRYVTSTAASLLPKHVAAARRWFPAAKVFSMYGLTECKRVSYLPPAALDARVDSVGVPIPGTEFWVERPDGGRAGPDEAGELVVRGAHIMQGYWGKPELTAKFLRPGPTPGERVFYTGDLCRIDAEGYLYFIARLDEVIKTRGEKVAPREVEAALERIEGVRECAVIGVEDELLGTAVKAFLVLTDEAKGRYTARDVQLKAGAMLENYMVPKHIAFVDALPKTEMGKIVKKTLK